MKTLQRCNDVKIMQYCQHGFWQIIAFVVCLLLTPLDAKAISNGQQEQGGSLDHYIAGDSYFPQDDVSSCHVYYQSRNHAEDWFSFEIDIEALSQPAMGMGIGNWLVRTDKPSELSLLQVSVTILPLPKPPRA